jgi:hypothetical protein
MLERIRWESFVGWVEQQEPEPQGNFPPYLTLWPLGDVADCELVAEGDNPPVLEELEQGSWSAELVITSDLEDLTAQDSSSVPLCLNVPEAPSVSSPIRADTRSPEDQEWWLAAVYSNDHVSTGHW